MIQLYSPGDATVWINWLY